MLASQDENRGRRLFSYLFHLRHIPVIFSFIASASFDARGLSLFSFGILIPQSFGVSLDFFWPLLKIAMLYKEFLEVNIPWGIIIKAVLFRSIDYNQC